MLKHRLKGWFRICFGRLVWHSGLWRLFDRRMPRRLTILAGHCVGQPKGLPANLAISQERLLSIVEALGARFDWSTVGAGVQSFDEPGAARSMVALSFDDGYRDNLEVLVPVLQKTGAKATVFLEGAPLAQDRVSWSHKYFWLIHVAGVAPEQVATELLDISNSTRGFSGLSEAANLGPEEGEYQVKRVLKYECDATERDAAMQRIFLHHGGEEKQLRDSLYLSRQQVLDLQGAGVELGGHTQNHEVLATLSPEEAFAQIAEGRRSMESVLGPELSQCFAYPFGRSWDYEESSKQAVSAAGYSIAVTTHGGVYEGQGDKLSIGRIMLSEDLPIYQIMMEASGAYQWLRRFGIDLA